MYHHPELMSKYTKYSKVQLSSKCMFPEKAYSPAITDLLHKLNNGPQKKITAILNMTHQPHL